MISNSSSNLSHANLGCDGSVDVLDVVSVDVFADGSVGELDGRSVGLHDESEVFDVVDVVDGGLVEAVDDGVVEAVDEEVVDVVVVAVVDAVVAGVVEALAGVDTVEELDETSSSFVDPLLELLSIFGSGVLLTGGLYCKVAFVVEAFESSKGSSTFLGFLEVGVVPKLECSCRLQLSWTTLQRGSVRNTNQLPELL